MHMALFVRIGYPVRLSICADGVAHMCVNAQVKCRVAYAHVLCLCVVCRAPGGLTLSASATDMFDRYFRSSSGSLPLSLCSFSLMFE